MKPIVLCLFFAGSALLRASPLPAEFDKSTRLEFLPQARAVSADSAEGVLLRSADECCRESIQADSARGVTQIAVAPESPTLAITFAGILGLAAWAAAQAWGSQRRMPKS